MRLHAFPQPAAPDPVRLALRIGPNRRHQQTRIAIRPGRSAVMAVMAVAGSLPLASPSQARWDLSTTWEIEKQLQAFIQGLPGGPAVKPPRLFLYRGTSYSKDCIDQTESGIRSPSYCPGDNTVYLEMGLGDQMNQHFGDFGALSIVSHEFGHAYLMQTGQHHDGKTGELDADRFAGAFARYAEARRLLEPGDVQEAQKAFEAVGDQDVGSADHHGLPQERLDAFNRGYAEGFVGQPGAGITPSPSGPDPTPTPQAPVPTPQAPSGSQPAPAVLGLGMGLVFAILIGGALIAIIRRASEDEY